MTSGLCRPFAQTADHAVGVDEMNAQAAIAKGLDHVSRKLEIERMLAPSAGTGRTRRTQRVADIDGNDARICGRARIQQHTCGEDSGTAHHRAFGSGGGTRNRVAKSCAGSGALHR